MPDSRKSLSRVRRISAFALITARKIGLSAASRIRDSELFSSVGVCTISIDRSAIDKKVQGVNSFGKIFIKYLF